MNKHTVLAEIAKAATVEQIEGIRTGVANAVRIDLASGRAMLVKTPRGFAVDCLSGELYHYSMSELKEAVAAK